MSARISRAKWFRELGFTPRRGQQALYDAVDAGYRYLGLFSFPRGGKSMGAAKLVGAELLNAGTQAWVVAPNYQLGSKIFSYVYQDYAEAGILRMAKRKAYDVRGGNMSIELPNGSWIRVLSAENPDSLRAEELDWLLLDEASALPPEIFQRHLFARLEKRKGRCVIPTTPKGKNWLFQTFRLPSLKTIDGQPNSKYEPLFWSIVVSADPELGDLYEPGIYDPEYIERARRLLPRPIFIEQVGGDFSSYAGLIYDFNPSQHQVAPFPIPEDWPVIVGWDHGADNPTAILVASLAPNGCHYWWGEIYLAGLSASEYANALRVLLAGRVPSAVAVDPSAKQVRIELARIGMSTCIPHDKQIEARVIRVTALMREGKWKVLAGRCPNLVREMQAWEWDEDAPETRPRPNPHQACHALDAMGYATLANVSVPQIEGAWDGTVPGETPEQRLLWAGVRKRDREREDRERERKDWTELEEDPFEETAVFAEAFDPRM